MSVDKPLVTDEEIDMLWGRACVDPLDVVIYRVFARAIAALAAERQRADDLDWIRCESRDCGCSQRIEAAILRGEEQP